MELESDLLRQLKRIIMVLRFPHLVLQLAKTGIPATKTQSFMQSSVRQANSGLVVRGPSRF